MRTCKDCGDPLPPDSSEHRKFCDECINRHKREGFVRRAEIRRIRKEQEQLHPAVKTLAEIQREAQAAGMSYGNYVAKMRR